MLGTMPPPIGGVTISVKNLYLALSSKNIQVGFLIKGLLQRYSIAHVHCYSPIKRLILLTIGKFWAKKVVFTIHGMHFDQNNFFNIMSLKWVDGVVILNDNILVNAPLLKTKPLLKITALVKEGIESFKTSELILSKKKTKPRLLLYAQHGDSFAGEPIYGVPFIQSLLGELTDKYTLIFTDINNVYPEMSGYDTEDVVRIAYPVNFEQLLTEVDVYLRPTSKDGDAIAIQEALLQQVPVVASDVVERPEGVETYQYMNKQDFLAAINKVIQSDRRALKPSIASVDDYIEFYQSL